MNKSDLTAPLDIHEMRRTDALYGGTNLLCASLDIDLSRPPEPGSFRFSLEEMRRGGAEWSARPPGPTSRGRAPDAPATSRRTQQHAPVRKTPARPSPDRETAGRARAREVHREKAEAVEKEGPADARQRHETRETQERADRPAQNSAPDGGAAAGNDGTAQAQAAAPATPGASAAHESASDTGGAGKAAAGQGASAGGAAESLSGNAPPLAAGSEKGAAGAESPAGDPVVRQDTAESAGGGKAPVAQNRHSRRGAAVSGDGGTDASGKPVAATEGDDSGKAVNPPMAGIRAAAASAKGGAHAGASGSLQPQAAPPAVSREGSVSQGAVHTTTASGAEASSGGRVVRVSADGQSGQTGLFQGHHAAPGHVQGSGGATAPEAPAQPFHQELLQQVAEKAVFHLRNGRAEARIDLKPESLGHLKLHVSTDHGQVTLRILTESTWVRDMIESHISHLKNELQQHNLQIDRLDVSVSGGEARTAGGDARASGSAQNTVAAGGSAEDDVAVTAGDAATARRAVQRARVGLVDYFA